jgi:BASS family bile acid:Na+ symporter
VDPTTLLKLVLLLGVVLMVVSIGARVQMDEPLLLLRRPTLTLRSLLAMYVLYPALVLLLVWLLPLRQGVGAVLLGFAVSPVLPPWAKKGPALGARADYVIGLELLSTAVSLLLVPLMIAIAQRLFGVSTSLDPRAMVMVLLATVVLPLGVGIGLARLFPRSSPRLGAVADRLGSVVRLLGAVVRVHRRHRCGQRPGVRMQRIPEQNLARAEFRDLPEVHDHHPVRHVAHHVQVVADEHVGQPRDDGR